MFSQYLDTFISLPYLAVTLLSARTMSRMSFARSSTDRQRHTFDISMTATNLAYDLVGPQWCKPCELLGILGHFVGTVEVLEVLL
jgi:hypothetical protein